MSKFTKFLSRNIYPLFFRLLPIKSRRIVFSSFGGRNYSGNPRVISEKIQGQNLDYELVWLLKKEVELELPKGIKKINTDSFLGAYYLYTAKYWIDDSRKTIIFEKRPQQIYFQTWHGTPLKKIEFDAADTLPARYLNYAVHDSKSITYLVSGNRYSSDLYPKAFNIPKEKILNIGTPRNDGLISDESSKDSMIEKKKSISILFAPTFRNMKEANGIVQLDKLHIEKLRAYFVKKGYNFKFMVKFHPNVNADLSSDSSNMEYLKRHSIELIKDGVPLENLFDDVDVLITDYSSIFFDFALLKKGIILFNYDQEEYLAERGFYISLSELPVPKARNSYELLNIFENRFQELIESSESLLDYVGNFEDGDSTEKIIDLILKEA
ncbi:CDP-glycerol glycerophosphotransferase family protein [Enterococcus viikkiensis]|uniref:CDP-glycerol glycerophosphotransferase family protein n=1 Tax=Enterococcus viikkiensis TaxID=930854 RepID=UPI0010F9609A|nr:CDP-glycerol glycerophosphotransferase family protein [Enterococcus viikkiensis]